MIHMDINSIGMAFAWIIFGLAISMTMAYAICYFFLWEDDEDN